MQKGTVKCIWMRFRGNLCLLSRLLDAYHCERAHDALDYCALPAMASQVGEKVLRLRCVQACKLTSCHCGLQHNYAVQRWGRDGTEGGDCANVTAGIDRIDDRRRSTQGRGVQIVELCQ